MTTVSGTSTIDVNAIVSSLMSVERQPLSLIANRKSAFEARLSAFGTLKSALSTFQTSVGALASASKFNAQTVTSASPSVFTATSNGKATAGDNAITVNQLARSQKIAMDGVTNTTDVIGTGKLTISFGTFTPEVVSPATPASFTPNPNKAGFEVTIDSSNNTLAGVRDAINAANGGVTATIVNNGSVNRLVITSKDTGEVNGLRIAVQDDDGNSTDTSGLSRLAYDPMAGNGSGRNLSQLQTPLNALLNIDGIDVVKSSNTVSDAIEGVTLNLLTTSNSQAVNLSVATDQAKIRESVTAFVDAYNKVMETLSNLTRFDETGRSSGRLLGDATTRSISTQLRTVISRTIDTGGTITSLSDIGVAFQRDGKLAIDNTKLTNAMTNNFNDIAALFSTSARASDPQVSFLGSTRNTQTGTFPITVSQIGSDNTNMVGTINGANATGVNQILTGATGDASEGLRVRVLGNTTGARGTITFVKGYAAQFDDILNQLLDEEGILNTRTEGISESVKRLDRQTEAFNDKLAIIERRYRQQYTRLDTLLSSLQNTSSFLSQQIQSLSNNR